MIESCVTTAWQDSRQLGEKMATGWLIMLYGALQIADPLASRVELSNRATYDVAVSLPHGGNFYPTSDVQPQTTVLLVGSTTEPYRRAPMKTGVSSENVHEYTSAFFIRSLSRCVCPFLSHIFVCFWKC